MAAKTIIVLVAFPVLVHAIFTVATMLLGAMLPSVLPMMGTWSDVARKGVIVAAFLLAVRGSFGVCRRMWPVTVVK
jgi:predicted metal-binding membrane protein